MEMASVKAKLSLKLLAGEDKTDFDGVYAGDFLSRAMSRVGEGELWITIMNNVHVIAVASLTDAAAVILAEDVTMDESVLQTASAKGVTVYSCSGSVYEICRDIASVIS